MPLASGPGIVPCLFYVAVQTFCGGLTKSRKWLKQSTQTKPPYKYWLTPRFTPKLFASSVDSLSAEGSFSMEYPYLEGSSNYIIHPNDLTGADLFFFPLFNYLVPFLWRLGQKRVRSHTASGVNEGEKFSQTSQIKQNQFSMY